MAVIDSYKSAFRVQVGGTTGTGGAARALKAERQRQQDLIKVIQHFFHGHFMLTCCVIVRSVLLLNYAFFYLHGNPSRGRIFLANASNLHDTKLSMQTHTHTIKHIHTNTHTHTHTHTYIHTHTQLREDLGYTREKKESTSSTSLKAMNVEDILNEV